MRLGISCNHLWKFGEFVTHTDFGIFQFVQTLTKHEVPSHTDFEPWFFSVIWRVKRFRDSMSLRIATNSESNFWLHWDHRKILYEVYASHLLDLAFTVRRGKEMIYDEQLRWSYHILFLDIRSLESRFSFRFNKNRHIIFESKSSIRLFK